MSDECQNCGSTRKVTTEKDWRGEWTFCEVCRGTYAGHYERYPTNAEDMRIVLKAIAQCTNLILDAIEKREAPHD